MDYAQLFNRKLAEFLTDMEAVGIQERVPEYAVIKASIQFMAQMDASHMPASFHAHVVQRYEDQILRRDEAFFLTESYQDVAHHLAVVDAIKRMWTTLDDDNKQAIWKHLQVLTLLSKRAVCE